MKASHFSRAGLFVLTGALACLALPACGAGSEGAQPVDDGTADGSIPPGSNPETPGGDDATDGGVVGPPAPPCDAAQTAAILASFTDETSIPNDVGAVAVVKDPACGTRYFARGASKDLPETTIHLIGSVTKTYVASLTLLLAEEGKFALSDSVTKWVADVPGGAAVTIEQLLNHTSGIYNYTNDTGYIIGIPLKTKYTPRKLLDIAFSHPSAFTPGEAGKWSYSNTNYVILGMIIESVTGKGIAEVLRERVLTPIGAKATFFRGPEEPVGTIAVGKTYLGANGATFMDPSASWACGNMVATVGDIADWAEKRGNGTFHSAAMQAQMTKGVPTGDDGFTYGAALMLINKGHKMLSGNGPANGHNGAIPGYFSQALYFPEQKATIAVILDTDQKPKTGSAPNYLGDMYLAVVNPYFGTKP